MMGEPFLRDYFRTHHGIASPLVVLHRYIREHGQPDPATVQILAQRLALPTAAVRSAALYYADLQHPPGALRVCRGTSCMLAGAAETEAALCRDHSCQPVYCLGYCDRSPAVLRGDGEVVIRCRGEVLEQADAPNVQTPAPPAMRCIAGEPIVLRHAIQGDFSDYGRAEEAGIYAALRQALEAPPEAVLEAVVQSGERGRGGAAFPTGMKWRRCAEASSEIKYVIANGDEGDPGSFLDRVLMEQDPHSILEGLAICAYAVGACAGVVFIRSEYPRALAVMERAVEQAREAGVLGPAVLGSSFAFDVTVFPGVGSYVCGEETALLNAIEGLRGEVRLRPPYPTESGLDGRPTVIDNVETLLNIPWIISRGAAAYRMLGTPDCSGTKALCLNHGFARPGIVEVEFGLPLGELIEREAGGERDGRSLEAVLLGGPMGSVLVPEQWDVPICYTAMAARGIVLGHGGLVAVPEGSDWAALLVHWLTFMRHESCGKCVPCRLGSQRALELAEHVRDEGSEAQLRRLMEVMAEASLCAFGQLMPGPMRTMIDRFGDRIFPQGGP